MKYTGEIELTAKEQALVDLLWDYLKKDPEHKDRRQTAYGTKTKAGLARSIYGIVNGPVPEQKQ
jgi:hypothetical protein